MYLSLYIGWLSIGRVVCIYSCYYLGIPTDNWQNELTSGVLSLVRFPD